MIVCVQKLFKTPLKTRGVTYVERIPFMRIFRRGNTDLQQAITSYAILQETLHLLRFFFIVHKTINNNFLINNMLKNNNGNKY